MKLNETALDRAKKFFLGKRFFNLTVIDFAGIKHGARHWQCLCDCGRTTAVNGSYLKSKSIKSCGCLQRVSRQLPEGEAAKNRLFEQYKNNAKSREIDFLLSRLEFFELCVRPCFYCGDSLTSSMKRRIQNLNGDFKYTGVDRINSSIGYTVQNCVPCCAVCNKMKLNYSTADFIAHLIKIVKHLKCV